MEKNQDSETFRYTYSAKQQEEIQSLRHQLRDILGAALSGKEAN